MSLTPRVLEETFAPMKHETAEVEVLRQRIKELEGIVQWQKEIVEILIETLARSQSGPS